MLKVLEKLKSDKRYQEIFEYYYDFIFDCQIDCRAEPFTATQPLTIVARDGSGGIYAAVGEGNIEELPISYIDSEGQYGIIAKSFNSLISLIVQYPFWRDILAFSENCKIDYMIQMVELLKRERLEFRPDIENITLQIIEEFVEDIGITTLEELRIMLLNKSDFKVYLTKDGSRYGTLIGEAKPQECILWKQYNGGKLFS